MNSQLLACLVGDALVEPFWPQGTGANRAVLSAMDASWTILNFLQGKMPREEVMQHSAEAYKVMMAAAPEDLNPNMGQHSLDPNTRYKKNTSSHFH